MEKASSGTPRLTRRSAAKQVKTPPKVTDSEENGNCEEDGKKGSVRRGRTRKSVETKPKTNGESSLKSDEANADASSLDGCESESSVTANYTSSSTTRKSSRVRRCITPGPDFEVDVSKKLRRSTSESKLDSVGTPTKRRQSRARSESKDFVFTPTKEADRSDGSQVVSKDLRPSTLIAPAVESIAEAEEESSQDEPLAEYVKQVKSETVGENNPSEQDQEAEAKELVNETCTKADDSSETREETAALNNSSEAIVVEKTEQLSEVVSKTESNVSTDETVEISEEETKEPDPVVAEETKEPDPVVAEETKEPDPVVAEETKEPDPVVAEETKEPDPVVAEETKKPDPEVNEETKDLDPVVAEETKRISLNVKETHKNCNELYKNDSEHEDSHILKKDEIEDIIEPCAKSVCDKKEVNYSFKNEVLSPREEMQSQEIEEEENDSLPVKMMGNVPTDSKLQVCNEESETQYTEETNHERESDNSNKYQAITDSDTAEIESMECEDDKLIQESPKKDAQFSSKDDEYLKTDARLDNLSNFDVENNSQAIEDASNTLNLADVDTDENMEDPEAVLIEDSNDNINEEVEDINLSFHDQVGDCTNLENKDNDGYQPEDKSTYQNAEETCPLQIENKTANSDVLQNVLSGQINLQESDPIEIIDDCTEEEETTENYETNEVNVTYPLEEGYTTNHQLTSEVTDDGFKAEEKDVEEKSAGEEKPSYSSDEEDIYKDMSNFGSDDEEQREDKRNESSSLTTQSEDSYDSSLVEEVEEEELDEDYEEEEQDSENRKEEYSEEVDHNTISEKIPNQQEHPELKEEANGKETVAEEGNLQSPSPMTYDKALEILNKDRDTKIDDEEFFDMFTQELNKVSEPEANSDSDIAIVDEYIPENPPKPKPVIKTIKRPLHRLQAVPIQQQYALQQQPPFVGHFNQIQSQHPPHVPRVSFPPDVPLNQHHPQFIQDFSQMNAMRNQNIYKHYGPSVSNAPDSRMYDAHIPTQVSPGNQGFMGYKLGHPAENPLHFSDHLGLKVRNMDSLNMQSQAERLPNQNYPPSQMNNQMFFDPHVSMNSEKLQDTNHAESENQVFGSNHESNRSSSPEHGTTKSQTSAFKKEDGKVDTPILKLFGLDKKKLNVVRSELKKHKEMYKKKWCKLDRQRKKAIIKHVLEKIDKEDSLSPSGLNSCEASNDCSYPGSFRDRRYQDSSTESSSSESEFSDPIRPEKAKLIARQIHLKRGDGISVTLPRVKDNKSQRKARRGSVDKLRDTNIETLVLRRKRRKTKKKFTSNVDSSDDSDNFVSLKKRKLASQQNDSELRESSKRKNKKIERSTQTKATSSSSSLFTKMVQKKQKKTAVLQSAAGAFTVENPATSQSSESEGASQSSSSDYLEAVKQKIKGDVNSGKNKLSNLFTSQSLKANSKKIHSLKSGRIEKKRKRPIRDGLKKLPVGLLEQLEEESKPKPEVSTDSDVNMESQKKKKKKHSKVKVKSAALDKEYIPYVTPETVATQFTLNRLDIDDVLTTARGAAKFRSSQLYGSSVQRITILDFTG